MLVSAIMPTTFSRKHFWGDAAEWFNNQDWTEKELIVIHDESLTVGEKLNQGIEQAKGDIIIRWDDDDWSCRYRITDQVNRLLSNHKSLTGYNSMYFWDDTNKRASHYWGAPDYCLGTSMCFLKKYWEANRFEHISKGEDLYFQKKAKVEKDIISVPADKMMVARLHGNNTSSSIMQFPMIDRNKLSEEFLRRMNVV
jgi:hypothetical protein